MNKQLQEVINFWFEELEQKQWWQSSEALDTEITNRFGELHTAVVAEQFADERDSAEAYLAEIIVLDQFSRNMFRNTAKSFTYDDQALALAKEAVEKSYDQALDPTKRQFIYMPYMHSESKEVHEEALQLFTNLGNEENIKFEKIHKNIIDRFGRYPHRNDELGRESTEEEKEYLANNHEVFF